MRQLDPERWRLVESIFTDLVQVPEAERQRLLDRACGDDQELRAEIGSLLAADSLAGSFLEHPIARIDVDSQPVTGSPMTGVTTDTGSTELPETAAAKRQRRFRFPKTSPWLDVLLLVLISAAVAAQMAPDLTSFLFTFCTIGFVCFCFAAAYKLIYQLVFPRLSTGISWWGRLAAEALCLGLTVAGATEVAARVLSLFGSTYHRLWMDYGPVGLPIVLLIRLFYPGAAPVGDESPAEEAGDNRPPDPGGVPTPADPDATSARSPLLGSYKLLREIGQGGMGTVYSAERADGEYHQQVAIKVMSPFLRGDGLRRFRKERQILAGLDHPNIARMLDGGTTADGHPFLVMEYIEGQPIDSYCEQQRCPIRQRLELFLKVCAAVESAHQQGVIHRDLKPANILVKGDGVVKLLDFGIAKLIDPGDFPYTVEATATGSLAMTPEYASPEQVFGREVTAASDVYSLGVVLYKLLTGRLPNELHGAPAQRIAQIIAAGEPLRPSIAVLEDGEGGAGPIQVSNGTSDSVLSAQEISRQLTGDLDRLVLTALRKDKHRRHPSVAQLAGEIKRVLRRQTDCGSETDRH